MPFSAKGLLACVGVAAAACGGSDSTLPPGTVPLHGHVFIVVEENTNYADVVGAGAMPYLDTLIGRYGLATQYYANTHPSIGNYFMMTVGQIVTNNDSYTDTVRDDNIVRRLIAAGKTWKSYAESLPSVGYTGGNVGQYARRHNPLSYLSDVTDDASQKQRLVPFTQFAQDLAGDTLPNYSFLVPGVCHDAHDCALDSADTWLRSNIKPLIQSARFQQDGMLVIVFDEASSSDRMYGGGQVAWVVVSAKAKPGYRSMALYQHQSTLRLMAQALGLTAYPGAAAGAAEMSEFFTP
jgi:phosphatidylinositol-3-phosphatase